MKGGGSCGDAMRRCRAAASRVVWFVAAPLDRLCADIFFGGFFTRTSDYVRHCGYIFFVSAGSSVLWPTLQIMCVGAIFSFLRCPCCGAIRLLAITVPLMLENHQVVRLKAPHVAIILSECGSFQFSKGIKVLAWLKLVWSLKPGSILWRIQSEKFRFVISETVAHLGAMFLFTYRSIFSASTCYQVLELFAEFICIT
jgi:hypothetical protein